MNRILRSAAAGVAVTLPLGPDLRYSRPVIRQPCGK